jgi:hypothetical protein
MRLALCHDPSLAELATNPSSRIPPDPRGCHPGRHHAAADCNDNARGLQEFRLSRYAGDLMSKKTKKRKARLRRSKANHGKRPNTGRG